MGTLYIVGTPIGNMEDITLRALRVLGEVGVVAAEDTRVARRLLSRYDIRARLVSFNEHSPPERLRELVAELDANDVALVSDAGMPGVNDPGQALVNAAAAAGRDVAAVPGASAVTAAAALSGLASGGFVYAGFLPRKRGERLRLLASLARQPQPIIALEAPHRLRGALRDALDALGDRRIAVCREMTKMHEEVFRGSVSAAVAYFVEPRGEFTLVIEGKAVGDSAADESAAAKMLDALRREGARGRDAVDAVAGASGLPRRKVYRLWLDGGGGEPAR